MKNLELENYNVAELSHQETSETFGGNWWSEFKSGFQEGFDWAIGVLKDLKDAF